MKEETEPTGNTVKHILTSCYQTGSCSNGSKVPPGHSVNQENKQKQKWRKKKQKPQVTKRNISLPLALRLVAVVTWSFTQQKQKKQNQQGTQRNTSLPLALRLVAVVTWSVNKNRNRGREKTETTGNKTERIPTSCRQTGSPDPSRPSRNWVDPTPAQTLSSAAGWPSPACRRRIWCCVHRWPQACRGLRP